MNRSLPCAAITKRSIDTARHAHLIVGLFEVDFADLPARHREEVAGKELTDDPAATDRRRIELAALLHPLNHTARHDERVGTAILENRAVDRAAVQLKPIITGALMRSPLMVPELIMTVSTPRTECDWAGNRASAARRKVKRVVAARICQRSPGAAVANIGVVSCRRDECTGCYSRLIRYDQGDERDRRKPSNSRTQAIRLHVSPNNSYKMAGIALF